MEEKKQGLNTNSNTYIIIYSAILVVIVAFLLAFIYSALKPQQDVNVALDKKKQILAALNFRNLDNDEATALYSDVVVADMIVDVILTKLAGIVCLGAAGGMLGALKAERKRKVAVYLREYRGFLRYFLILALEGNETPDEILQKAKKQDRFKHMGLQNIYSLRAYTLPKWLPNQANQLQEAFHLMGTLQKNELHQAMKEYDSLAAEFEQIAAKQSCKAKELYTKLGLAGGLLMAILLL